MAATVGLFIRASLMRGTVDDLNEPPHVYVEVSTDDVLADFAKSKGEGVIAFIKAELERRVKAEATQSGIDITIAFEGL